MEMCDVVDEFGTRTGRVVSRGTELAAGEFYLVVHVWIRDQHGNFLIQQRARFVSDPGIWATTVGYVLAGEESLAGVIREVQEELGIRLPPAQCGRFCRNKTGNRVEDIWLVEVMSNMLRVPTLGPEVQAWKWVSKVELEQMTHRGDFFRYSYLDDILGQQGSSNIHNE